MEKKNKNSRIEKNAQKLKENNSKKGFKIFFIFIFIILILFIAVFCAYLVKSKGNLVEATLDIVTDIVGTQKPIFVLVLGVSEDTSASLTDTIMLAGYNPQSQKSFVVSIPRDTYTGKNQLRANGFDKINSKYQIGYQKIIKTVEELTGVVIDYYVVIKNTALIDLVDSIGGVEFDVPIDMDYDDITQNLHIHLNSGLQILSGKQAEGLVRFRHNNNGTTYPTSYGDNDYGRMKTQREFLKTFAKQLIQLNNIPKVKSIATAVFDNIETNIELTEALSYIPFCLEMNLEDDLRMEQLPGESMLINNLWFYVPNNKKISILFDELISELELEENFKESHYKRIENK